jgi:DNA replication protein DnaC
MFSAMRPGHTACVRGYSVLFTTSSILSRLPPLRALRSACCMRYLKPKLLVVELGYLPIDKPGANLLFQIISERYECGAILFAGKDCF